MQSTKRDDQKSGTRQRLLGIIATIGMVAAALYYCLDLFDRVVGHSPNTTEQSFVPITSLSAQQAPWIATSWIGETEPEIAFEIQNHKRSLPVVILKGIGYGEIQWTPQEISSSGKIYRGKAVCKEHGGVVQEAAELHREPDNTLEFHVGGGVYRLVPKDIQIALEDSSRGL